MASSSQVEERDEISMASGRVPASVRTPLGDDATFGLIELLDSERREWSEHVLSVAADRFERRLVEEISALREEIREELHDGLASVRHELATSRVEMLKWSFLFWVGQIGAMAGLLAFMLRRP
jgi:hypothetical protein